MITEFEEVVRSHFDYNDENVVHEVARILREGDTDSQNRMLEAVTSKMYDQIRSKADKIDFSSISKSRGDFTKIQNYDSLMECCKTIRDFIVGYHQPTTPIDTVDTAIKNLLVRKQMFQKAFVINSPIAVMTYNSIGLGCVYSISFLIATCVEYIKDPRNASFTVSLNTVALKNTDKHLMFTSLAQFNKSCQSGEFDQAMDVAMKQGKMRHEAAKLDTVATVNTDHPTLSAQDYIVPDGDEFETTIPRSVIQDCNSNEYYHSTTHNEDGSYVSEGMVGYMITRTFIFIAKLLIPLIRNIVYLFYHIRQSISDFYAQQAQLLEMNAYQLQYNTEIDEEQKKKIYDKQMKIAAKWRAIARKFDVDYNSAKAKAEKDSNEEASQMTMSDDSDYQQQDGPYYPSDGGIF